MTEAEAFIGARVYTAITHWLREEAPVSIKIAFTPAHVRELATQIAQDICVNPGGGSGG